LGKGVGNAALAEGAVVVSQGKGRGHLGEGWRNPCLPLAHVHDFGQDKMGCFSAHPSSGTASLGAERICPQRCRAPPRLQHHPFAGLQCPDHTDSWSGAILFFLFHIKQSWILVTVETSSPNYKEFDSLDVKSYNSSVSLKKVEIKKTYRKMITPYLT